MRSRNCTLAILTLIAGAAACAMPANADDVGLWKVYNDSLKGAKYIDLTHTITPKIPVWIGFGGATFAPAAAGVDIEGYVKKGDIFTYEKHGFEASNYTLPTDQLGTQLDPPAHWAPEYPAIDELPATYTVRPLVVIPMEDKVAKDFGYALKVSDIEEFEASHGRIPEGSVVFVRSGWSKEWPDPALAKKAPFPGVGLDALKFLHQERKILFHGHEPLDTDATPTLEGEVLADAQWLCAGRRRSKSRPGRRNRVPCRDWLSQVRRRPRWLCPLHRHLSARLEIRRERRRGG